MIGVYAGQSDQNNLTYAGKVGKSFIKKSRSCHEQGEKAAGATIDFLRHPAF